MDCQWVKNGLRRIPFLESHLGKKGVPNPEINPCDIADGLPSVYGELGQ